MKIAQKMVLFEEQLNGIDLDDIGDLEDLLSAVFGILT